MQGKEAAPSILLGLTGLGIEGGIASVTRCIASALDEKIREGRIARTDRVLLLDDPADPPAPPSRGDQLLSRGSQLRFVWQLWRSYRRHSHDLVFFDIFGLARGAHVPAPGFPPSRYAIFCHGIELGRASAGSNARTIQHAWRLLTNSHWTAGVLRERFPEVADRIRVTPLCIDPARTEAWELRATEEPGTPAREPAALIAGRMWAEERGKGHDALIEAWPAVRRRVGEAELWIVGDGDDRGRLEEKARDLGLVGCVRFLGRVSDEELSRLYHRASLFTMPSRQEGFGLVYAEAMWHGMPCIGSTADAAGEVITDGETGLLVPYGDVNAVGAAVAELLDDPTRRRTMGETGRRDARERFGYERFCRDLLAALDID